MRIVALVLLAVVLPMLGCESVNEPMAVKPFSPFEKPEEPEIQKVMDRQSSNIEDRVREDERRIIDQ